MEKKLVIILGVIVLVAALAYGVVSMRTNESADVNNGNEVVDGNTETEITGPVGTLSTETTGSYMVTNEGLTLYVNNTDGSGPNPKFKTVCDAECEKLWTPYIFDENSPAIKESDDATLSKINIFERADGRKQYALGTQPLYIYSGDTKRGDTNGVSADWSVAKP